MVEKSAVAWATLDIADHLTVARPTIYIVDGVLSNSLGGAKIVEVPARNLSLHFLPRFNAKS
jgi:hypothetical protein